MTATAPPTLIGLDWGTSSLRGYLMDAAGGVSDAVSKPWGIQHLPPGGFAEALAAVVRQAAAGYVAAWQACRQA